MHTFSTLKHLDVIKDIVSGLVPRVIGSASNSCLLEQLKEAFSHLIVVAVPSSTHAAHHPVDGQKSPATLCWSTGSLGLNAESTAALACVSKPPSAKRDNQFSVNF
jgi:hypothetical protein